LIAGVPAVPNGAKKRPGAVLVHGELTGHNHRLEDPAAGELWDSGGVLFLRITAEQARIVHPEHLPITLPAGTYHVWQQREYSPEAIRRVMD
jgi:hypothetical protein